MSNPLCGAHWSKPRGKQARCGPTPHIISRHIYLHGARTVEDGGGHDGAIKGRFAPAFL